MKQKYYFILEGTEASGKGIHRGLLEKALRVKGYDVIQTHEPGGTPEAEIIRKLFKDPNAKHNFCADLCLMIAARSYVMNEIVWPALEQGIIVLSDRSFYATVVYQGFVDEFVTEANQTQILKLIQILNKIAMRGLIPTHTFIYNLPVEEAMRRIAQAKREPDRFDDQEKAFHQKIIDGYLRLPTLYPDNIEIIDSNRPIKIVHEEVLQKILKIIEGK